MIKKIADLFRSDEFLPTASVFPDIDKDRLVIDLGLEKEGMMRGSENKPESSANHPDHLELKAISRVEDLRRRGLENYEVNRRVYSERLNKAISAKMLVETEASEAKAKFLEEITRWKSHLVNSRERVQETFQWRAKFRKLHQLERPANPVSNLAWLFGISMFLIMLESLGNSYLFAQENSLGLLGGVIAAFLVSLANVLASTLFGFCGRFINYRSSKKLFGVVAIVFWVSFALGYNMAVAHFRDAIERVGDWNDAGVVAIDTLINNPLGLDAMESWILFILGVLISIFAFMKGYSHSDPYPGYSKVAQDVIDARQTYNSNLDQAIYSLADHRDDAVENLRAANDEIQQNINDSIDALYGQKALHANLGPFLEQCDIAANYLLSVYRDTNKAARNDSPPKYFNKHHTYKAFTTAKAEVSKRQQAEAHAVEVSELVGQSIRDIYQVFDEGTKSYYSIDELEGTSIPRAIKPESHDYSGGQNNVTKANINGELDSK